MSDTPDFALSGPCVLVVDDNDDNLDLISRMLQRGGYATVAAKGGREALEIVTARADDLSLVLLDWMMPEVSGLDVLRAIRERFDADELPVVMCTARGEGNCVAAALADGANDYVSKPVEREALLARVDAQVRRRDAAHDVRVAQRRLEDAVMDRTNALAALKRDAGLDASVVAALKAILSARGPTEVESAKTAARQALALLQASDERAAAHLR